MRTPIIFIALIFSLFLVSAATTGKVINLGAKTSQVTITTISTSSNISNFTQLLDAPDSYSTQGGKCVAVKAGEDGLEFVTCAAASSTYNATYALWSHNQTTPANTYTNSMASANNNSWMSTYNATYHSNQANNTWNQTLASLLYAEIKWGYNQTYSGSTYNVTYHGLINNVSYLSTYNATYHSNQANNTWNQTLTDSLYSEIKWGYNQTYSGSTYNVTYHGLINNVSYLSTYNATYHSNQANNTWNQTLTDSLYSGIEWDYNQTTISNTYTDTKTATNNLHLHSLLNLTGVDDNTCTGTNKVTNVTINNGNLTILCSEDLSGAGGNISGDGTESYFCGFKSQNVIEGIYPLRYTSSNITLCSDSDTVGLNLLNIKTDGCGVTTETWDNYGNKEISGSIIPKYTLSILKTLGNLTHRFNETWTEKLYVTNKINDTTITYATLDITDKIKMTHANDDGRLMIDLIADGGAVKPFNVSNNGDVGIGGDVYATGFYDNNILITPSNATFNQSLTDTLYSEIKWGYNQTTPSQSYADNNFLKLTGGQLTGNTNMSSGANLTIKNDSRTYYGSENQASVYWNGSSLIIQVT